MSCLINLLSNAIKFTPEEGKVSLDIRGDIDQAIVQFIVSDTGIGIAEKDMPHLFKPFVQIDGSLNRIHEGTGLGLSLVYRLTEMHGGSVSVESEVGEGSRFIISLPWKPTEKSLPSTVNQLKSRMTISTSSATVLLADDNIMTLEIFCDYLETKGYQVISALDGLQAVKKAAETHPDIILMDIQMPNIDGLEATRQIRKHAGISTIPIIALTALAMPGDREQCLKAGVNEYLSKPVNLTQLIEVIERHLLSKKKNTDQ